MQPKNNVQIPEYLLVKHTLCSPNIKDSSKKQSILCLTYRSAYNTELFGLNDDKKEPHKP